MKKSKIGTLWLAAALLGVAVAGLAGCAPVNGYPRMSAELSTPREAEDALPDSTADWGLDQDSSRLVGTVDHVAYFVSTSTDPDSDEESACLILVNTDTSAAVVSNCSPSEDGMYLYGVGVGSARVSGDTATYPESAGWVQLGNLLLVKPNAAPSE